LLELIGITGFVLLAAGGIIYTIGAILYGVGKKYKWMHSIFHLCIFIASLLQFLCILLYVM
jgi:hemolysin III